MPHLIKVACAGDMDATMKFYEKHFGLKQTRFRDIPEVRSALCKGCMLQAALNPLFSPNAACQSADA